MQYTVRFTQTVAGIVSHLHPETKKQLRSAFREISADPYLGKELQEELADFLSYRFNRYRIIYQVDDIGKTITVYIFGHHRDVYELLSKLVKEKK